MPGERLKRVGAEAQLAFRGSGPYPVTVSFTGTVHNGVVVLPPEANLPEGATVRVEPLPQAEDDPLVALVDKLAKPRPHLPSDYALNHGHYVSGEPWR